MQSQSGNFCRQTEPAPGCVMIAGATSPYGLRRTGLVSGFVLTMLAGMAGLTMGNQPAWAQVAPDTAVSNPAADASSITDDDDDDSAPETPVISAPVTSAPAEPASDGEKSVPDAVPASEPVVEPVNAAPASAAVTADATGDAKSAVVFMYHRFGENGFPSTNITREQFEQHVAALTSGKYTVLPVPRIVDALREGRGLPDHSIGITVDDAYRSVYDVAWPVLRSHNLPMTVFVSTEQLDDGYSGYMTWDMIRELVAQGVTIGGHSQHHAHLPEMSADTVRAELANSAERFRQELGFVPEIFAYPYGEASDEVVSAVRAAGFKAAFGQQSGALSTRSDMMYLPRFALNEHYGEMDRFTLAANSLPLEVSDVTPSNYLLERNPPAFGFTLEQAAGDLACYPSEGTQTMSVLGDVRVEIRLDGPVSPGRWRINCTSMGPDGRWRWFGMLYTVPKQ